MSQHSSIGGYSPLSRQDGNFISLVMEQECTVHARRDYLNQSANNNSGDSSLCGMITPDDRMKLVDWCYGIVDLCQFNRETVAMALGIADRFMSTQGHPQDVILYNRGQYQLLIMTALYISIKMNERSIFSSEDFSAVSRGTYSKEEIESMELVVLHGLGWRLCCPTALQMGLQIIELMMNQVQDSTATLAGGAWDFLQEELAFQTENAVRGYYFTMQRSSTVAVAAILSAIEQLNATDYKLLVNVLTCVMVKELGFDSPRTILNAWDQLRRLMEENGDPLDGPRLTRSTVTTAKAMHSELNEAITYCDQSASSISSSLADAGEDDDSFATVHVH